jgi:hypothetical protein
MCPVELHLSPRMRDLSKITMGRPYRRVFRRPS